MARFCAGTGADFLTFALNNRSEVGGVSWEEFLAIHQWLAGVEVVADADYHQWSDLEKHEIYNIQCNFEEFFENHISLSASSMAHFQWWIIVHSVEQVRWLEQVENFRGYFQMPQSLFQKCLDSGIGQVKNKSFVLLYQPSKILTYKQTTISASSKSFEQVGKLVQIIKGSDEYIL